VGGYNSGRTGGRPIAETSKRIDIAWMIRKGLAVPGGYRSGTLSWNVGGEPAGWISYTADMVQTHASELRLSYTRGDGADRESVQQTITLTFTEPNYGGRRWWMICPSRGNRVGKLYLPNGGDRFAGGRAWRIGYKIQRVAHRDRPFEKLLRLQRKLGSDEGYEAVVRRPKGMWRRTYERHVSRYWELDADCGVQMVHARSRLE
jgi:hypothetical protein